MNSRVKATGSSFSFSDHRIKNIYRAPMSQLALSQGPGITVSKTCSESLGSSLPKGQADRRTMKQLQYPILNEVRLNQSFNSDCLWVSEIVSGSSFIFHAISLILRHILTFLKLDAFYNCQCFRVNETDEIVSWQCFSLASSVGCCAQL